ncbi:MAG: CRISPR-associated endonuclease Cas2 [Actinomycetota bacterium]|nr:CRISPR-associated endonuclease Cas2 [Actinomycetota bacterium]
MARRRFLVAYDIRDPKRLREVHSGMKRFGYPLQYSVFICDLDPIEKISLREIVGGRMNQHIDSLVLVDLGDPASRGIDCFEFMGLAPPLPRSGPTIL